MVFSVQQGEHGPLVVYKLTVPKATDTVLGKPSTSTAPSIPLGTVVIPAPRQTVAVAAPGSGPAAPRLSSLQPTVLGTVVMPASRARTPQYSTTVEPPVRVQLAVPTYEPTYRNVSDIPVREAMINEGTGDYLTLDEVNEAVIWRRDTVEKLRQVPITPRF